MHTASYEFLIKPKESAGCHQTLSSRVGSGDETNKSHDLSYKSHELSCKSHDPHNCRLTVSACQYKKVRLVWCLLWADTGRKPVNVCGIRLLRKLDNLEIDKQQSQVLQSLKCAPGSLACVASPDWKSHFKIWWSSLWEKKYGTGLPKS